MLLSLILMAESVWTPWCIFLSAWYTRGALICCSWRRLSVTDQKQANLSFSALYVFLNAIHQGAAPTIMMWQTHSCKHTLGSSCWIVISRVWWQKKKISQQIWMWKWKISKRQCAFSSHYFTVRTTCTIYGFQLLCDGCDVTLWLVCTVKNIQRSHAAAPPVF